MSITSRINEMSSHIEQAYDELQGLGADLTNVNKNIENISMVLDDIYDSMPQVSGEGTSLTLEDTRVGKIKSTLKGNTSQTTYSGKNLYIARNTNSIQGGLTYTVNDNGTFNISGTASSAVYFTNDKNVSESNFVNGNSYTLSSNKTIPSGVSYKIEIRSATSWLREYLISNSTPTRTFTIDLTNAEIIRYVIQVNNGITPNLSNVGVQLELGSSATSYEPYVGGTPSPNPSYPQPVNVVSGDNEINVVGKNLLYLENGTKTDRGITGTISNDNVLTYSGTATQAYSNCTTEIPFILPNGTYTFSIDHATTNNERIVLYLSGGTSQTIVIQGGSTSNTFTLNGTNTSMRVGLTNLASGTTYSGTVKMQLENSSSASSYLPYSSNTYNIDLPVENLLPITLTSQTKNNIQVVVNEDKSITLNGTANAGTNLNLNYTSGNYISLVSGETYTISIKNNSGIYFRLAKVSDNSVVANFDTPNKSVTFTSNYTGDCYAYITVLNNTTLNNLTIYPIMQKGSKITGYSPYGTTPIELCKIGNYQDYFGKSDGRNLFDLTKAQTQSSNTPKVQDDKIVASSPIAWSSIYFTFTGLSKNTTYYIKSNLAFTSGGGAYSQIFGGSVIEQSNVIKTYMNNITTSGDYSTSFSTDNNDTITISFCTSGNSGIWSLSNIILSSEDIDYEPFGVGKWYLHKEIGKVVFNGSETWYKSTSYSGNYYCQNGVPNATFHDINCFSNLTNVFWYSVEQLASGDNGIMLEGGSSNRTIDFKISSISTLADFKTFLGNNNLILYYTLDTPTNTEITYQPLIDQLNLLEKAMSKDGQTNISQVNNDLPFIISASALKEWQESASLNSTLSMVNTLSLGNTLNTQENDIQPIEVDNIEPLEEEENEES